MTTKKLGKTVYRQEVTRAINANRAIRRALQELIQMTTSHTGNALIARAAMALGENLDALLELERMVERAAEGD